MASSDADQGYLPSILDRLIDPESTGSGGRRGYRFEQMRDTIKRDLRARGSGTDFSLRNRFLTPEPPPSLEVGS